ncbi:MAG: zf-HC2 domain-containing protein [candidate division WOR-3 bacterium]|nr:zf-HC2 domain-containing protein [candidate division WOR-3 bacterium]
MLCEKVQAKLIDYLNQELSLKETQKITEHLKQCARCSMELQTLKSIIALVREVRMVKRYPYPAEDFLIQVRRKIKNLQPKPKAFSRLIPVFASVVILLVVIITTYILNIKKSVTVSEDQLFTEFTQTNLSATHLYEFLDPKAQELINDRLIAEVISDEVKSIDWELIYNAEPTDLFSQLTDDEKEKVINELFKKYFN